MKKALFSFYVCLLLVAVFIMHPALSFAQHMVKGRLLVLSKKEHTLSVINASNLQVLGKISVGDDPHEVTTSADGKKAYVSIYGGGSLHTINVIDLTTMKRLKDIDTRPLYGPHGITFVKGQLWFTVEGSKAVARYNALTDKMEWAMGTGEDRTHMLYVTADGKTIYTTNVASGTVSILQEGAMPQGAMPPPPGGKMPAPPPAAPAGGPGNWEQTIIPVSKGAEGFDVSPDGKELWTACAEDGTIYIIDLAAKKVKATIDAGANGANRLSFSPDGKLVFVSSLLQDNLFVFDANTQKLVKQIPLGGGAAGILMQPDGSRAFVACTGKDYVAVIDLASLSVSQKLHAGGGPDGMAWAMGE